jgi:hypothetical protein
MLIVSLASLVASGKRWTFAGEFAPVPKLCSWREQAGKPARQIAHRKGRDGGQGETHFARLDRR